MKNKKYFKVLVGLSSACFLTNIIATSFNKNITKNEIKNINKNNISDADIKEIDAKLIGADKGTINVKFTGHNCTIIEANSSFVASGDFNFNGGKLTYNGTEYSITEIADNAFYCSPVRWYFKNCNLTIPSTVKRIGKCAFARNFSGGGNKEIIGINFEEGVEYIGEQAFWQNSNIELSTTIKLPNSLKYIGKNAFSSMTVYVYDLSALDHVIKLDIEWKQICSIGDVIQIILKDQKMIEAYSKDAFWCSSNKYFACENDYVIHNKINSKYIGGSNDSLFDIKYTTRSDVKLNYVSHEFVATGDFNFNGGKFKFNDVEYTITEIGDNAFKCGCDDWYFKRCNLTIPSTVKKIGDYAFYRNSRGSFLTKREIIGINFNEGLEDIGALAFWSCKDIESDKLVLPNSLQHIGNRAFEGITSFDELDLTALDHVISLDADPFSGSGFLSKTYVTKILVKDQTTKQAYLKDKFWSSAAKYLACKDEEIKEINSQYIGGNNDSTFIFSCSDPNETKIKSVSRNFEATEKFNFNNGKFIYGPNEHIITEINDDAFNCYWKFWYFKKCKLTIPGSIKKIGNRAFYGNSRNTFLTSKEIININFNEGLEDIGEQAFYKCDDLESDKLVLPNSLQHIGNNAFAEISPLKELDLSALDHVINIDAKPFDEKGCLYGTKINTIWVKDQTTKDKYCNNPYWSSSKDKIKVK